MQTVTLILDIQNRASWTTHEVEDVRPFLMAQFPEWPDTARIYHGDVSQLHDVTPACPEDVDRLAELEKPLYVIVFPGDPITIIIVAVVVVAVALAVVMMMLMPPLPTMRNTDSESPNNELSARTNKARPMARIPDIYGQVRSTPDLIAVPYSQFEDHVEVEYAYMCIGRGSYDIEAVGSTYEVRDDTTLIKDIGGASVEIYGPDTSPNSGDAAELTIGDAIGRNIYNVKRFTSVNGQELIPPNAESVQGNANIWFTYPNEIHCEVDADIDFTEYFYVGDDLTIEGAWVYSDPPTAEERSITVNTDDSINFSIPSGDVPAPYAADCPITIAGAVFTIDGEPWDLSGTYVIESVSVVGTGPWSLKVVLVDPELYNSNWAMVTAEAGPVDVQITIEDDGTKEYNLDGVYEVLTVGARIITLVDPASVNADWDLLNAMVDDKTDSISPTLSVKGLRWVGPFTVDVSDLSRVLCNFVALQGLFIIDDEGNQKSRKVRVRIELIPVDAAGTPTGAAEYFETIVRGSATTKTMRAQSKFCVPTFTGLCTVSVARVTEKFEPDPGTAAQEIKWRDLYAFSPCGKNEFGDVTTVQTKTMATTGSTAIKERKLRVKATRKLPSRVSGSTFTEALTATTNAADIISAICLDSFIGRRTAAEIDFDTIYDLAGTGGEISTHFGTDLACQFNYTFDSDNLSFEQTISTIAAAIHCGAYRRGNVIKISFERAVEDSVILFNHRNKLPGSETRTQSFGAYKDYDGVEYQWVDPEDDALVTMYLPSNRSAANPKKVESVGIRNRLQAYIHAWRIWNRIRYHNLDVEFEATQEAHALILNDRVLVADNTRTGTQDGEVRAQNALALTLSQPVTFTAGVSYVIFLQLADGTIDSIPITAGSNSREVVLSRAPLIPLVLDPEMYAVTTYMIVGDDAVRENAFLIAEKEPQSNFTCIVRGINYDDRYYANDLDYVDGVIDIDGYII